MVLTRMQVATSGPAIAARETQLQQCPSCKAWQRIPTATAKLECDCGHVLRLFSSKGGPLTATLGVA
jgi:hypothetical protein